MRLKLIKDDCPVLGRCEIGDILNNFMPEGKNPYFENVGSPVPTYCKTQVTFECLGQKEVIKIYHQSFYTNTCTHIFTHTVLNVKLAKN